MVFRTLSHPVSIIPTLRAFGQTTQVRCANISTQYIYNIYTMYLQYPHSVSTISTKYNYNIYTIYLQYLHNISTISTQSIYNIYTMYLQYLHNILYIQYLLNISLISTDYLVSAVTDPSPPMSLPHIDPYHSTNVSALAGASTRLNCRVYRSHKLL